MSSDPAVTFGDVLAQAGLIPQDIQADGVLHRCKCGCKPNGDASGWYVLYDDRLPAGAFGCWRCGIDETWRAESGRKLSEPEREEMRRRRAQRERDRTEAREQAKQKAKAVWESANPETGEHRYLRAKQVGAHGIRTNGSNLLVPVRDASGALHQIQYIDPNGEKRFLAGGAIAGHYHAIGKPNGVIVIAEGYATGATIHEATGHACAVAFNAGNLRPVAEAIKSKHPDTKLIIVADNDTTTEGNPGVAKATDAARAVGAHLAIPVCSTDPSRKVDANDLCQLEGTDAVRRCVESAQGVVPEVDGIVGDDQPQGRSTIRYRRLSDVKSKAVRWLWPGRIAKGKPSVLAGNPGLGKSQLAASMASIVSRGGHWPVDRSTCEQGSVVFLSAEDDAEDTIKPRLEAAGADVANCYILDAVQDVTRDGDAVIRAFNLKTDIARLSALLDDLGDVALVVIDPITAYLGGTDSHNNAEVRALLAPLGEMAARHGVAVIAVSHLNKSGSGEALMRVTGSLAFVAAARAAYLVARDQDDPNRRLFLPIKNNLGNDSTGLAFRVESYTLDDGIETSRVMWESEPVTVTADEVMSPCIDPEERSATDEAEDWLREVLAPGSMAAADVQKEARHAGISDKALRRARERLGVKPFKSGFSDGWRWQLPAPKMPSSAEDAQDALPQKLGILGGEGHLREAQERQSGTTGVNAGLNEEEF